MSTYKNARGKWVGRYKVNGVVYKKETFLRRQDAADWATKEREKRFHKPLPNQTKTTPTTYFDLCDEYLNDCSPRMQKNTIKQKSFELASFIKHLKQNDLRYESIQNFPATEITRQMVKGYISKRQALSGNKAANRTLRDLKAMFNWGIKNDKIEHNPCNNIPRYPEDEFVKYVPPEEDIDKVILNSDPDLSAVLQALKFTAGRLSEILNLRWEDVNFYKKEVRLWTRKRKGGAKESDLLPMSNLFFDLLQAQKEKHLDKNSPYVFCDGHGAPFIRQVVARHLERACKVSGVKIFTFHAIRHAVATKLIESGSLDILGLQNFLRHRKLETTLLYIKSLNLNLRKAVPVLDRLSNGDTAPLPCSTKIEALRISNVYPFRNNQVG